MQTYQELKTKEGTLRGYLHQPNTTEKVPLVVMYHGFTGYKGESNFLFTQFSRYLCKHNIASLRFDFLGSGESDQDFSYMTFTKEVQEAKAILDYAQTFTFTKDLIVLGLSMGGAVATQVAKDREEDIDKLILWAPAGHMNKVVEHRGDQTPRLDNGNFDLGGIELSPAFVEDMISKDLFQGIEAFKKPVCLFHGKEDTAVPVEISEKYKAIYPNSQLYLYDHANHTFQNVMVRRQLFKDNVDFILE